MTNKQAIEKLNDIRCHVKETSIEEQALVMAIEALKKAGIYGDIIYREDALMCLTGEYPADFKHDELIAKFIRRIRALPSAQPERKVGKWTEDNACEFCGFKPWYERDIHTLSYCPNCGADMRGEQYE